MRNAVRNLLSRERERGQALVLFAGGLAVFLAFVGMAVDVGMLVATRTDLQKSADAAAFAAGQDLPSAETARAVGANYVASNISDSSTAVITVSSTYATNDTVSVRAERPVEYMFLKFIGLDGADVAAEATVRVGAYVGGAGLLPWGFIASNDSNSTLLQNPCYLGQVNGIPQFQQNVSCQIKFGAGESGGGDFGALALGGNGGSIYRDNIKNGSTQTYRIGQQVPAETGDKSGPTLQGAADRFAVPPPSTCPTNDISQIVNVNPDGTTSIKAGCETHPRIGIIPVVDQINNPQMSTILGFSFVILERISGNGNNQRVVVRFVEFVTEIPGGIYEGFGGGSFAIKLIQ